jgi:nicotinamide-nucleotide amidase
MMFNKKLVNAIKDKLKMSRQTIAVAESVTAGLLQASFASAEDASAFFQGGITAYNIGQKCRHLLVEPIHAGECDCVSEEVSGDMCVQVCSLFKSDYGIGITGYAARVPEKNIKELYAYYAISFKGEVISRGKINTDSEEGLPAQLFYVDETLRKLNEHLISEKNTLSH